MCNSNVTVFCHGSKKAMGHRECEKLLRFSYLMVFNIFVNICKCLSFCSSTRVRGQESKVIQIRLRIGIRKSVSFVKKTE